MSLVGWLVGCWVVSCHVGDLWPNGDRYGVGLNKGHIEMPMGFRLAPSNLTFDDSVGPTGFLNPRLRYYYIWFLKINRRHVEILLPVWIFTFASPLAWHSASAYQISFTLGNLRFWL